MSSVSNNLNSGLTLEEQLLQAEQDMATAKRNFEGYQSYGSQVEKTAANVRSSISTILECGNDIQLHMNYRANLMSTLKYFELDLELTEGKKRDCMELYSKASENYNKLYAKFSLEELNRLVSNGNNQCGRKSAFSKVNNS